MFTVGQRVLCPLDIPAIIEAIDEKTGLIHIRFEGENVFGIYPQDQIRAAEVAEREGGD